MSSPFVLTQALCLLTHRGPRCNQLVWVYCKTPSTAHLSHLHSVVSCKKGVGLIDPSDTSAHETRDDTYLSSPGVQSSVFSFGPPRPGPRSHFCNSMQATERCQKALVSLKAELGFKADGAWWETLCRHQKWELFHTLRSCFDDST